MSKRSANHRGTDVYYDVAVVRKILAADAPIVSAPVRLNVDPAKLPRWNMRPAPTHTRRRTEPIIGDY